MTLETIISSFCLSPEALASIRASFASDMKKGWEAGRGAGAPPSASSLKMLTSHVNVFASGQESGVYYAVDLGGSNLRVLRVCLCPGMKPIVVEERHVIPHSVTDSKATAEQLFDFIAATAKVLTDKHTDDVKPGAKLPVGFTFSFPMSQDGISSGRLIEWTKGFLTRGCVGEDPAMLLSAAFKRLSVPLQVVALCNDTVGTLMTCAYEFGGCPTCRVGVILGTGTNAAYVDPSLDNLIVNVEWGGFTCAALNRNKFDIAVDEGSPNQGKQFLEKMVSGMYLGELTRLAVVESLESSEIPAVLLNPGGLETEQLSNFLEHPNTDPLSLKFTENVSVALGLIGNAVLDRSADICATALAAVAEKSLSGRVPSGDGSVLLTVGLDGSLFTKGFRYPDRLRKSLAKVAGVEFAQKIRFVRSNDGSGVGAAVIAAAVTSNHVTCASRQKGV